LNSLFGSDLILLSEGTTDVLRYPNETSTDAIFAISPSNPGYGQYLWSSCYYGIRICNAVAEGIKNSPIDEEDKPAIQGEVSFLRAMYYYILTCTYGDVPFYFDDVKSLAILKKVEKLPRMSASETRLALIADMELYADYMKVKEPKESYSRITAQAAYMLIAKLAMWEKDYDKALAYLKKIQKIYGKLDQYPLLDTRFRDKNKPESIFEVQYAWSKDGIKKTSTVACFFTPGKKSGTAIYDGVEILELGKGASPWTSVRPLQHFLDLYENLKNDLAPTTEGIDPRRDIILGYHYEGSYFAEINDGKRPWMGPKFWCPNMDNISDGNNQKVFRYADALLMIAECANELGDPTTALACLKEVRARAKYVNFFESADKASIFQEIMDERARELTGEYQRKWDLVRWGVFYSALQETLCKESPGAKRNLKPYHIYYPIPDTEVVRSGGVLTNDAYNK
ncbi:MAG: RagB/SusD family nutrient uptake outer membrane protein, partial [Bacteroides sp.]